jgi:CRP-like cAMP-binding protein
VTVHTVGAPALRPEADARTEAARDRDLRPDVGVRYRHAWSQARLSAAVALAPPPGGRAPRDGPLSDEIEFFTSIGAQRDLSYGVTLVHGGENVREVHLVVRGAVAVVSDRDERRPILGFTVPDEICGPVPVLLREPALWDAVTVTESSVITVPAARFSAEVRDRWMDRWCTRSLSWLAAMGARSADLDCDLTGQVAVLLLRHRAEIPVALCRRTIADLLDADEETIGPILLDFERLGAVRLRSGRIAVTQVEILRSTVAAARRERTRDRDLRTAKRLTTRAARRPGAISR